MITLEPTTREHIKYVAAHMRAEDAAEVMAVSGHSPLEALQDSVACSYQCETALEDGVPVAIFGMGADNILADRGAIWLLTTERARRIPKMLLRVSREVTHYAQSIYPVLVCNVDTRYHAAVRWLEWLGFRVIYLQDRGDFDVALMERRRG